jgi:hypothetical protein
MGAVHKYDLTSDVTHLLVGETNTEKYKFVARERSDVLVLVPEWIEAVRQSWMDGGDTDLHALEQKYRLPTFHGLSICVTGFEDRKCYQDWRIKKISLLTRVQSFVSKLSTGNNHSKWRRIS